MQATLPLHPARSIRLRLWRLRAALVRYLRARMREESPVIDRVGPEVKPSSGFHIRSRL
jgi:hypothetical protein